MEGGGWGESVGERGRERNKGIEGGVGVRKGIKETHYIVSNLYSCYEYVQDININPLYIALRAF